MSQTATSHYTFGDNDLAAARLERLARAYAASSAAFLRAALPDQTELVIDLGSGLGFTTELLRDLTKARRVVGYERSANYVQIAAARIPSLTFRQVDVLLPPYPDRDADAIYSRFLLTHLHEPAKVVAAGVSHLRSGGRLLLEETSDIRSPLPVLQRYYAAVAEMQAHYGQQLSIGLRLAELVAAIPNAHARVEQTEIPLPSSTMARIHAMNIATWKHDPYMLEIHGLAALEELEIELHGIANSTEDLPPVVCVMAQAVVERH